MSSDPIATLKGDIGALVNELELIGAVVFNPHSDFVCPFHPRLAGKEDRSPSCGIFETAEGWKVKCQSVKCGFSGDVFDVRAFREDREVAEVMREHKHKHRDANSSGSSRPFVLTDDQGPDPTHDTQEPSKGRERRLWPSIAAVKEFLETRMPYGRDPNGLEVFGGEIQDMAYYPDKSANPPTLVVFRIMPHGCTKKTIRQAHAVEGGFELGQCAKPWPLLNREKVRRYPITLYVEGETCAKKPYLLDSAFSELTGIATTTNPFGSCYPKNTGERGEDGKPVKVLVSQAHHTDLTPLSGKDVVLWPDFDEPGLEHMRQVAELLKALPIPPRTIRMIQPELLSLGDGEDLVDFVASLEGMEPEKIIRLIAEATEQASKMLGPSASFLDQVEDVIAGAWRSVEWPDEWPHMNRMADLLYPQTVTVICGAPSAGKSSFLLQMMRHWLSAGIPAAVYMLESSLDFHLRRALAQHVGDIELADFKIWKKEPYRIRSATKEHAQWLNKFAEMITPMPTRPPTPEDVGKWMEAKAAAGKRVLVIDPIAAIDRGATPAHMDGILQGLCRSVAVRHKCAVILTTHPDDRSRGGKQNMMGGQVWDRLSDTVMWLYNVKPKDYKVKTDPDFWMTDSLVVDRIISLTKVRDGPFKMSRIGFFLDKRTFRFTERGHIQPKGENN